MSSIKVHTKGYLNSDNLLPPVVVNDHKLSREEWEEKIAKFHAKHHGMSRAEAMMEYLKVTHHANGIAQKATADSYAVYLFEVIDIHTCLSHQTNSHERHAIIRQ